MSSSNARATERQTADTDEHYYEIAPDESPTEAVLTAVVAVTGRPATPAEATDAEPGSDPLPPLFEAIDPDALDTLAAPAGNQADCRVTFSYAGCTVSVEEQEVTVATQT